MNVYYFVYIQRTLCDDQSLISGWLRISKNIYNHVAEISISTAILDVPDTWPKHHLQLSGSKKRERFATCLSCDVCLMAQRIQRIQGVTDGRKNEEGRTFIMLTGCLCVNLGLSLFLWGWKTMSRYQAPRALVQITESIQHVEQSGTRSWLEYVF